MATLLTKEIIDKLSVAFTRSRKRLLLLDYDGTLVPFAPTPEAATPSARLMELLAELSVQSNTTVAIVSGRDKTSLESWFSHMPVGLSAEHGHFMRQPNGKWSNMRPEDDGWKVEARAKIQAVADYMPGAFIEEKQTALCLHYRLAQHDERRIAQLIQQMQHSGLAPILGDKVVEVRASASTKADALAFWDAA